MLKELIKNHRLVVLTSEKPDSEEQFLSDIKIIKIPYLLSLRNPTAIFKYWLAVLKYLKQAEAIHFFTDLPNYLLLAIPPLKLAGIFQTEFSQVLSSLKRVRRKNEVPTKVGLKYFITTHGTFSIASLEKGWRKFFLRKIYQRARWIFCISNFTKQEILKRVNLKNTVVINNGVDFKKFDALYQKTQSEVVKRAAPTIISVGAIKPRKGYEYALQAFALLKNKYPDIQYNIVGDKGSAEYLELLNKIIKENELQEQVHFLENISDRELVTFYGRSNLFLFTPVNHAGVYFEGFGLVCLEAGVCELPVVGSKDCGVVDAVQDGVTGYLVPQKAPEQIAAAIDKILSDEDLARQMGRANREFARHSTWQVVAKKYERYYN